MNQTGHEPDGPGSINFENRAVRERCIALLPGQYFDKETNLHYNGARDYDPAIGRYIQSDPVGLLSGLNSYGYANQNPLSFTDPSGLFGIFFYDPSDPNFVALGITVPPKVPG